MNIFENITINLTPDDVREILKDYIEKQGYRVKGNIQLRVGSRLEGFGRDEYPQSYFESAVIDVEKVNTAD